MKVRLKPGGALSLSAPRMTLNPGDEADLPRKVVERWSGRLEVLDTAPSADEVTEFHVGGGWYEIPGEPYKVRKAEALAILGRSEE